MSTNALQKRLITILKANNEQMTAQQIRERAELPQSVETIRFNLNNLVRYGMIKSVGNGVYSAPGKSAGKANKARSKKMPDQAKPPRDEEPPSLSTAARPPVDIRLPDGLGSEIETPDLKGLADRLELGRALDDLERRLGRREVQDQETKAMLLAKLQEIMPPPVSEILQRILREDILAEV